MPGRIPNRRISISLLMRIMVAKMKEINGRKDPKMETDELEQQPTDIVRDFNLILISSDTELN